MRSRLRIGALVIGVAIALQPVGAFELNAGKYGATFYWWYDHLPATTLYPPTVSWNVQDATWWTSVVSQARDAGPAFVEIQNRIVSSAGLHVVTPEYNGSFPGVLKYFIDMLKFPESFERKPVAFVGEAAGVWGGLRAVEQLQMIFGYRNAHPYPERVFIAGINNLMNEDGTLKDQSLTDRLAKQCRGFAAFTTCIAGAARA